MRDRLGISDTISIKVIRGEPEMFSVYIPITVDLKIPRDCPYHYFRYDNHVEFQVLAHSEDEARALLDGVLK